MKTIVLRGPGKSSLTTTLMETTLAAVREAGGEPIFLTGEGDAFSAGLNLKEVASLDVAGMAKFLGTLEDLVKALYEHPAPVVAWINGHAIAGGCVMALCADVRIMTGREGPRVGLNEAALGLEFPPLTFEMIRRRVCGPALDRVILEGALFDAKTAKELGLIDSIGEEPEARAMIQKMSAYAREAYARTKRHLRGRLEVPADVLQRFRDETIPHWVSPAVRERLLAAIRK
jgi:enoyl-CoA hydratase/carnithine racemase